MSKCFAGFLPGLPQVLHPQKSPGWDRLHRGMQTLGTHLQTFKPDVIVLYSSQWLSVLGTSVQTQVNPKGLHVDENWHEWGDLEFDFRIDAELGNHFVGALKLQGLPSKPVNFDNFPIDTGTLVATRLLNPKNEIPLSVISSWVYADAEKSRQIGRLVREECSRRGVRAAFIACSLLSGHFTPHEINPAEDTVLEADDAWNRKILNALEAGDLAQVKELAPEFAKATAADMQFNAFHWLSGVLEGEKIQGTQIHAYGPLWGTGAAVLEFNGENVGC